MEDEYDYEYEWYEGEFTAVDAAYRDADGAIDAASDHGDALTRFSVWYQGVHGYVCVVICLFGIVSNAMNIAVLTRRSMVIILHVSVCLCLSHAGIVPK